MRKKHVFFCSILIVIGVIGFYIFRSVLQETDSSINTSKPAIQAEQHTVNLRTKGVLVDQSDKVWDEWIADQTVLMRDELFRRFREELPHEGPPELAFNIEDVEKTFREAFKTMAEELKKKGENPPSLRVYDLSDLTGEPIGPKPHTGPQTADALLFSFEDMAANPMVDEKYPQAEWVEMLLDKGVTIEHFGDYSRYLAIRGELISLENRSSAWTSERYGIPPTEDWETYKSAYIDQKIWENQQIQNAQKADPTIDGGIFRGPDARTFLPTGGGRYYVKRNVSKNGAIVASAYGGYMSSEDSYDLFVNGIEPKGYQIIYLDDNDYIVAKPPPVISPEVYKDHFTEESRIDETLPSTLTEVPSLNFDQFFEEMSSQNEGEQKADAARNGSERDAMRHVVNANAEWKELFRLATTPESDVPSQESIEAVLLGQYYTRFQNALNLISRHGPKEGLRRLDDPEVAELVVNLHRASYTQKKNASR